MSLLLAMIHYCWMSKEYPPRYMMSSIETRSQTSNQWERERKNYDLKHRKPVRSRKEFSWGSTHLGWRGNIKKIIKLLMLSIDQFDLLRRRILRDGKIFAKIIIIDSRLFHRVEKNNVKEEKLISQSIFFFFLENSRSHLKWSHQNFDDYQTNFNNWLVWRVSFLFSLSLFEPFFSYQKKKELFSSPTLTHHR